MFVVVSAFVCDFDVVALCLRLYVVCVFVVFSVVSALCFCAVLFSCIVCLL